MAIDKVRKHFQKWRRENDILEFDVSSATVELAAAALHCQPERIAKTLSFKLNDNCILIVCAGDAKIDNIKYKNRFLTKPKMLKSEETESLIGHSVGGICPFGVNDGVKIYLDCSLKRFDTVFPACGSSNSAIELTMDELQMFSVDFECSWQ